MAEVKPSSQYSLNKTRLSLKIPLKKDQLSVRLVKVGSPRRIQSCKNKSKEVSLLWVELLGRKMADPQELQQVTTARESRSQVFSSRTKLFRALRHLTKNQM